MITKIMRFVVFDKHKLLKKHRNVRLYCYYDAINYKEQFASSGVYSKKHVIRFHTIDNVLAGDDEYVIWLDRLEYVCLPLEPAEAVALKVRL